MVNLSSLATAEELYANPMHPYTQSLLSAIPLPDPNYERTRVRKSYDPANHNYQDGEEVAMREVTPGHFVFCSEKELAIIKGYFKLTNNKTIGHSYANDRFFYGLRNYYTW